MTNNYHPVPGTANPYPVVYAVRPPYAGLAITAVIFGSLSVFTSITVILGLAFGFTALLTGILALKHFRDPWRPRSGKPLAIMGIVFGSLGIAASLFIVLVLSSISAALSS